MKKQFAVYAIILMAITACKKIEDKKDEDNQPLVYDSVNFNNNIQPFLELSQSFNAIVNEVKKGRTSAEVSETALINAYITGTPTLQSITTSFYNNMLMGSSGWFSIAAKSSGSTFHPDTPGSKGSFGGYMFDENGFEPEQMIEKGMFGSTLTNKALELLRNNPTLAQVDQALFLFGSNPSFKNSGNTTKHGSNADRYLANYIARRDRNNGNGYYSKFKKNFIKLQEAVKAGKTSERDEAVAAIAEIAEKANAATIINYCYASISNLSQTNLTDAQKAATIHAIGECHGFTLGWKTVNGKKITDAQIDEIMNLLNAPVTGGGKPLLFITDRLNQIVKLQMVISNLQNIYGFRNVDLEEFKNNWVAVQDR
ncbi:MAG: hypothetical protein ACK4K9_02720 [Bacteroidia bacterium]